jgi:hypothetical protein
LPEEGVEDEAAAVVAVEKREGERYLQRPGLDAPDDVGALVAVEQRLNDLDRLDLVRTFGAPQLGVDPAGGYAGVELDVLQGDVEDVSRRMAFRSSWVLA